MINHINFGDEPSIRRPSPNIKDSFSLIKAFDNYAEYALSVPNFIGGEICLIRNENKLYYNGELDNNKTLLYYKTHDNQILEPYLDGGGLGEAQIIGNAYKNGQGVIAFDRIVTEIGESIFDTNYVANTLLELIVPDTVTKIGNRLAYRQHLDTLIIPDSVTEFNEAAFEDIRVVNLYLGKNVPDDSIYYICDEGLIADNIYISNKHKTLRSDFNGIATKAGGLIRASKNTVIDDKIYILYDSAISSNLDFTSLVIPASVETINNCNFKGITKLTFNNPIQLPEFNNCSFESTGDLIIYKPVNLDNYLMFDGWNVTRRTINNFLIYYSASVKQEIVDTSNLINHFKHNGYYIAEFNKVPDCLFNGAVVDELIIYRDDEDTEKIIIPTHWIINTTIHENIYLNKLFLSNYSFSSCGFRKGVFLKDVIVSFNSFHYCSGKEEDEYCQYAGEIVTDLKEFNNLSESFVIREGAKYLGSWSSKYIKADNIILPESLLAIGNNVFRKTVTNNPIQIPKNVYTISTSSFDARSWPRDVEIHPENQFFRMSGGCIVDKKTNEVVVICNRNVIIPEGCRIFKCTNEVTLTYLYILESLKEFNNNGTLYTNQLYHIDLHPKNKNFKLVNNVLTTVNDEIVLIPSQTNIDIQAKSILSYAIQGGLYRGENYVFKFSEGLEKINNYSFNFFKCSLDIYLPKSLKYIGCNAFTSGFLSSITIHYAGTQEEWDAIEKDNGWLGSKVTLNMIYNS